MNPTTPKRLTKRKEGIGLCDQCCQPNYPQEYVGYGCMVCLDCLAINAQEEAKAVLAEVRK